MRPAPQEPEFGPAVALTAWFGAFVATNIAVAVMVGALGYADVNSDDWPLWLKSLTLVPLWACLLTALVIVSRQRGSGSLRRDYGLVVRPSDAALGLPIGVLTQLILVPLLYRPIFWIIGDRDVSAAARGVTDQAKGLGGIVLLAVLVVVGAPVVEELFFRGLVLRAIQARVRDELALVISATLFGIAHIQPLQLPALILFGVVAGYLAQRTGRLGPSIFAHVGFNATTVVYFLLNR